MLQAAMLADVPLVKGSEMHLLKRPAAYTRYNFIANRSTVMQCAYTIPRLNLTVPCLVQVSSKPRS